MSDDAVGEFANQRTAWCPRCDGPQQVDERGCLGCRERYNAQKREGRRKIVERRKLNEECIDCGAKLQEDDGARCVECHERDMALKRNRWATEEGRARQREKTADYRKRQQAKGLCLYCTKPRSAASKTLCDDHVAKRRETQRRHLRRKRHGISVMRRKRKRATFGPSKAEIRAYRPMDELLGTTRTRLLKAMRWFDWSQANEIFRAIGIEDDSHSKEWNTAQKMLGNLVRAGLVERRDGKRNNWSDYRLTNAGRIASDRIRNGELVARSGRKRAA